MPLNLNPRALGDFARTLADNMNFRSLVKNNPVDSLGEFRTDLSQWAGMAPTGLDPTETTLESLLADLQLRDLNTLVGSMNNQDLNMVFNAYEDVLNNSREEAFDGEPAWEEDPSLTDDPQDTTTNPLRDPEETVISDDLQDPTNPLTEPDTVTEESQEPVEGETGTDPTETQADGTDTADEATQTADGTDAEAVADETDPANAEGDADAADGKNPEADAAKDPAGGGAPPAATNPGTYDAGSKNYTVSAQAWAQMQECKNDPARVKQIIREDLKRACGVDGADESQEAKHNVVNKITGLDFNMLKDTYDPVDEAMNGFVDCIYNNVNPTLSSRKECPPAAVNLSSAPGASQVQANAQEGRDEDPMVLDLDGNGIHTSDKELDYDITATGVKGKINDIGSGDGALVIDADGDGKTGEDGKELLGNRTDLSRFGIQGKFENGFAALRAIAKNAFQRGLINGDGQLDAFELKMLEGFYGLKMKKGSLGSQSISLGAAGVSSLNVSNGKEQLKENFDGKGNGLVTQQGAVFTRTDGSRGQYGDIFFKIKESP